MAEKTAASVLQAVREAIELGWTYDDVRSATGVSTGVVAQVKRRMGLLPSGRHRATNDVLAAAREMVLAGHGYAAIQRATGAPLNAIKALRREAGLVQSRSGAVTGDVASAVREAISMGMSYAQIKVKFRVSSSVIADQKRKMGLIPQPATVPASAAEYASPGPAEYFQAIHDGILAGYAREQILSDRIVQLQMRVTELESQNGDLTDSITQTRARMSNWVGPTPLPHRNLSTGG